MKGGTIEKEKGNEDKRHEKVSNLFKVMKKFVRHNRRKRGK